MNIHTTTTNGHINTQSKDITTIIDDFLLEAEFIEGCSKNTVIAYQADLKKINNRLKKQKKNFLIISLKELLNIIIVPFESKRTSFRAFCTCRKFYDYLKQNRIVENNPLKNIDTTQYREHKKKLPKFLSETEVNLLLKVPGDIHSPLFIRDIAILELLYATGLRVTELVTLTMEKVDLKNRVIQVVGKGNKERIVCFGEQAAEALNDYIKNARPSILKGEITDFLFIGQKYRHKTHNRGNKIIKKKIRSHLTQRMVNYIIKKYATLAGLMENRNELISSHWLRHSFASHMVDHGANLIVVRDLLGHTSLEITSIYLHTAIDYLKELHKKHHPRLKYS
ncbi:tyrosine-type recombinase/integrase [Neisseria sp. Ec49-e6-T10]|uniref:tyrosine-type recombinase/integrase n=1 Tax=Neisseria sp. Ec49-e6-T10 TaxID=3140744 RepID=UPI003EBA2B19